jgi:ferredoxin
MKSARGGRSDRCLTVRARRAKLPVKYPSPPRAYLSQNSLAVGVRLIEVCGALACSTCAQHALNAC